MSEKRINETPQNRAQKAPRQIPNRGNHQCFACSPHNRHGLQMKFFTDDDSVFSQVIVPPHLCGWNNVVHGGVISAMLDEIMSWAAMYLLKQYVLTKSIRVDFLKPVAIGQPVRAEGKLLESAQKREARMQGWLLDADGRLCARAEGTFALIDAKMARRLKITDASVLRDLEPVISGKWESF